MNNTTAFHRHELPQMGNGLFLTDGGLETTLVYQENWELPSFAAFVLLDCASGIETLRSYYLKYIELALRYKAGMILESPTWRASPRWGAQIGYTETDLVRINTNAIAQLCQLRDQYSTEQTPMVISGCIGPQDDGYSPGTLMSVEEAARYHGFQAKAFAQTDADMLCAVTFTYVEEAIGATLAAAAVEMPIAISFTVETDGRLPSGCSLEYAIAAVDKATDNGPAYYMINCAHPTHFKNQLAAGDHWTKRIGGIRANASCKSHAELDAATELDSGDPADFGAQYSALRRLLPKLNIMGGCCGTDHRHVAAIAANCMAQ